LDVTRLQRHQNESQKKQFEVASIGATSWETVHWRQIRPQVIRVDPSPPVVRFSIFAGRFPENSMHQTIHLPVLLGTQMSVLDWVIVAGSLLGG